MILWPPQAGFEPTESLGVWVRRAPFVFYDARGLIINLWEEPADGGLFWTTDNASPVDDSDRIEFVKDNLVRSWFNVLRGIHGDYETWRLISCLQGKLTLVMVNCIEGDKGFGTWLKVTASEADPIQYLVAPGYGTAHHVLTHQAIFWYKWSKRFADCEQFSYKWNDQRFNIDWGPIDPILSERDKGDE